MRKIDQVTVASIDQEREELWFRDGTYARRKGARQPEGVVKAKSRARTARWRVSNDRAKRPEASVIAAAILRALVSSDLHRLTQHERGIVGRALIDLHQQGYSLREVLNVCRRLRKRVCAEPVRN